MLVLTRAPGWGVTIRHKKTGAVIILKYISRQGNSVRLGFQAPSDYEILRSELLRSERYAGNKETSPDINDDLRESPEAIYPSHHIPEGIDLL